MQRETSVPRVLTLVLQAIVILFLAMRQGVGRRRPMSGLFTPVSVPIGGAGDHADPARRARRAPCADGSACSTSRSRARCWSAPSPRSSAAISPTARSPASRRRWPGRSSFRSILAYGATIFRGDPVVIGIGMNLLASGLTAYLLRVVFGVSGTFSDPGVVGLGRITIAPLDRRAGSRLGVRPPVGADLGRLGADRPGQRRPVQDAGRPEAARRRRSSPTRPRRWASTSPAIGS